MPMSLSFSPKSNPTEKMGHSFLNHIEGYGIVGEEGNLREEIENLTGL